MFGLLLDRGTDGFILLVLAPLVLSWARLPSC